MKQFSIILYFSFTFYTFHFAECDDALAIPVDNNFTKKAFLIADKKPFLLIFEFKNIINENIVLNIKGINDMKKF